MSLEPGTELGPYRITGPLGAGGMGEVYRATDTKLHRDVAIKVLPEAFAQDEQRMKRFEREAQVLASLNHPNIAAIYGLEGNALVLELVEGPTLADRIREGPIPVEEALALARQIAEALSEAHEKGIIHRDLKPANVKLTEADQVKVLDFGLAKALGEAGDEASGDSELSQSPTLTRQATVAGMILGTAAYMSPEQAKGKRVDRRTDVWAFGAVLYEMLTGKRAFDGEDVSETLAAVLRAEPDLDALPAGTSPLIRRLLRRALRKNPRERLADMSDVRLEIEEALEAPDVVAPVGASKAPPVRLALAALLLVAVTALATWLATRPETPPRPPVARFAVALPESVSDTGVPAWSPDGELLVYPATVDGTTQLHARPRGALEATPIRGTEGADYPFFSPDGAWIGFFADGSLKKVPVAGGPTEIICTAGRRFGATWGPDDTIVFASTLDAGLWRVPASGGEPSSLTSAEGGTRHNWPKFLTGGKHVLFTISRSGPVSDKEVGLVSLDTLEMRTLLAGTHAIYASSGHLVFGREASLWAVPFDRDGLEVAGTPTPLVEDVQVNDGGGLAFFDVTDDGALAFWTGSTETSNLVFIDLAGTMSPAMVGPGDFETPRFSPDGSRIAVRLARDVYVLDTSRRGALTRLTVDGGYAPLWDPDGARITYMGVDRGIYERRADGGGDAVLITPAGDQVLSLLPATWSPDGETLMLNEFTSPSQFYVFERGGELEAWRPRAGRHNTRTPQISPDGEWLVYATNETGRYEILAERYPGPGERVPVSVDGGVQPSWSADGREIFYVSGNALMAVPFDGSAVGEAVELISGLDFGAPTLRNYDPAPDGRSFVAAVALGAAGNRELRITLNWLTELEELVPIE